MKMRRLRESLSYANVVSTVCLVLALGGTAYATHLQVESSDIVNNSLSGADFADGGLTGADVAAGTVQRPNIRSGSVAYTDLAPAAAPRTASLSAGWSAYGTGYAPVGYERDPYRIVRLHGLIRPTAAGAADCVAPGPVLTLPLGYRPARLESLSVLAENGHALIEVAPSGAVTVRVASGCPWISLENADFRAAL